MKLAEKSSGQSFSKSVRQLRRILAVSSVLVSGWTSLQAASTDPVGRAFEEAEVLFHQDPRWLGADGANSIPLTDEHTLWLFHDTFVAESRAQVRVNSEMVRNTIAIQKGRDPRSAAISFHWRRDGDGSPASFFPESGKRWYWPGQGARLGEGPLIVFLMTLIGTPDRGLGFAHDGYAVAVIDSPDASPDKWNPKVVDAPRVPFDAMPGTAVVRDGAYLVAVARREEGIHAGALVRYAVTSLAEGDVSQAEWWVGEERGWVPESAVGPGGPVFVLDDAGAECSLHWDRRTESFIHIASYGFGASTIGLRTAPAITGPWSSPVVVYRPPESGGPRPFVYAAKAHPELVGAATGDLVLTYATNSFESGDLFTSEGEASLYWPRFVVVPVGE